MLFIRSALFNAAFYLNTALLVAIGLVTFVLPRRYIMQIIRFWGTSSTWLFKVIIGGTVEFRGKEHIPKGGIILASKHQSVWETFALLPLIEDPVYIFKRELLFIPFFGWCAIKSRMIPINRGKRSKALKQMLKRAKEEIAAQRQIIIYPEGTRRPVDSEPHYKFGIAHIYQVLKVPCVPVAINSGLFWPRRSFMRYPGKVIVQIMPPMEPGMPAQDFFETLSHQIESTSNQLIAEARAEGGPFLAPKS
ncbi:MAG: 1-acyl-sn-glycerol-3-phosphate acyltransferase [Cohaesibacter sp.]|nr:1-acyl-sn-glycerol-3-phosphate acyltransferase [Cohaesibacter sp.]MCV6603211.1 1-acyl-sn-glycerol-3-phosphate acyltransferase [Cohaesibacter sp.]